MKDLISIVLPVYNGAEFLKESIDSVLAQTYQNWELLILDDCSTDETPNIALEYEAKDQRIHYYRNEKNLKLPGNLNKGFGLAKGEYLTWSSDDNRYRPEALETMLRTLKEKQVGLVFAYYQVIDEHDQEIQVIGFSNGDKTQKPNQNLSTSYCGNHEQAKLYLLVALQESNNHEALIRHSI